MNAITIARTLDNTASSGSVASYVIIYITHIFKGSVRKGYKRSTIAVSARIRAFVCHINFTVNCQSVSERYSDLNCIKNISPISSNGL